MTQIRPIQPADFPAIQGLIYQLIQLVDSPHAITQTQMVKVLDYIRSNPEMYLTLVAEEESQVVGLLSLVFYHVWFHPGGTALITELVVDENAGDRALARN